MQITHREERKLHTKLKNTSSLHENMSSKKCTRIHGESCIYVLVQTGSGGT